MSESTNTFLCVDYSGSTCNNVNYWTNVISIIEANPDSKIIFWNTIAKLLSKNDASRVANAKQGTGGTQPQCFAPLIPKGSNLIIITDGEVSTTDVQTCDSIINSREFSSVDIYFINTGGRMNLSVSAPFTRKTSFRIYVDGKKLSEGSSVNPIDLKHYNEQPEEFIKDAEKILAQIVMQNLGKNNQLLRNDLLDLQKNMLKIISNKNAKVNANQFLLFRELLQNNNYDLAVSKMKELTTLSDSTLGKRIEAFIQEMIKQCSGSFDFSFDILEPGRIVRATKVTEVVTEELPVVENYTGKFECPILLDIDIPCLLIKKGDPVFKDVEKGYMEALLTNPLMFLLNNELVDKLKKRLDHVVGLEATKKLFSRGDVLSPFSRCPISCIVTFGDEQSHYNATNFALANLFFGQKLVGQPELWLSVLYFVTNQITYLKENELTSNLLDGFKQNLISRMRTHTTNITLSGLPIEPLMKSPVDIAIWYCVVSPFIINNTTNEDDARNRLRSFGASSKYLVELLDLLGYCYDKKWTIQRISLYNAFAWMMNEERNNTLTCGDWRKLLRAQYQNGLILSDNSIILLDGRSTTSPPNLPQVVQDLTLGELLHLSDLVDRRKTINSIMLPLVFIPRQIPLPVTHYGYVDDLDLQIVSSETPISLETMRPFVMDKKQRKHWKECSEKIYGPLSKQLSSYNYFNKFVLEYNRFPGKEEFIKYLASKQANREENPIDTLPKFLIMFVTDVFNDFEKILGKGFQNITPSEFKRRVFRSMKEVDRAKMDGSDQLTL